MLAWLPQLEFYSLIKIFHSVVVKKKDLTVTEGPKFYKVLFHTIYNVMQILFQCMVHGTLLLCTGAILRKQKAWPVIHAGGNRESPDVCAKA